MRKLTLALYCLLVATLAGCKSPSRELSQHAQDVIFGDDTAAAQSAKIVWQDSAFSSVKTVEDGSGTDITVVTTHNYLVPPLDSIRISQKIEWVLGPWEGNRPWLEAQALAVNASGTSRPVWSLSDSADVGAIRDGIHDLYQTEEWGCCGACVTYRLYSLRTGRELLSYNHELVELVAAPADSSGPWRARYIGACEYDHAPIGSTDSAAHNIALLYYASLDSTLHTLLLRATSVEAHERTFEGHFQLARLPLDSALRIVPGMQQIPMLTVASLPVASLSDDYCIRVAFGDNDPVFVIPLKDDDFLVEKTSFEDYEIIRLK